MVSQSGEKRSTTSLLPLHRFLETCLPCIRSPQPLEIPPNGILHQIWSIRTATGDLQFGQVRHLGSSPGDIGPAVNRAVIASEPGIGLLIATSHGVWLGLARLVSIG